MERPSESDCCNSGCNPCILDVYDEYLRKRHDEKYKLDLDSKTNCMSPTCYRTFELVQIARHTHDTHLLTFECVKDETQSSENVCLKYSPGQHFLLKAADQNGQFTRAYTPIPFGDESSTNLCFTIIIKFYPGGKMSEFIKKLRLGSHTLWRGPYGAYEINYSFDYIFLIAQGTGIAPLFAVVKDLLGNSNCDTFLKLLYCCRSDKDILLRDNLYSLTSYWNFGYEVFLSDYTNCVHKYNEIVHSARLDKDFIANCLREFKNKNIQILICGSDKFNQEISNCAVNCDIDASRIFAF